MGETEETTMKTRTLTTAALLIAVGVLVSFIIDIPILPGADFLKYTPSDIPTLLGSFAFGPVVGGLIALLRAVLHGFLTGFRNQVVGLIMDIVAAVAMAFGTGLTYRLRKTRGGAALGLLVGSLTMTVISVAVNYFWSYPAYGQPPQLVWTTALPFNLLKCAINSVAVFFLYKPLSPLLHGRSRPE
jgi:riboflavin transporter FmnP